VTFLMEHVARLCCRHNDVRRAGQGRMWMECLDCGRRTPGIDVMSTSQLPDESTTDAWELQLDHRVLSKV
jgi:hypothetical protein